MRRTDTPVTSVISIGNNSDSDWSAAPQTS
jgi:hypothetical protein